LATLAVIFNDSLYLAYDWRKCLAPIGGCKLSRIRFLQAKMGITVESCVAGATPFEFRQHLYIAED